MTRRQHGQGHKNYGGLQRHREERGREDPTVLALENRRGKFVQNHKYQITLKIGIGQ